MERLLLIYHSNIGQGLIPLPYIVFLFFDYLIMLFT
nr:MAG TPA: hypothetical protein [Caudoviricetes sp.]DAX41771.1 MAG TPA: hypothetical protein [Caudoviricetes sp.]